MRILPLFFLSLIVLIGSCSEPVGFLDSLVLKTLDGEEIEINSYENKIVILNLWATWCKPCINEMPDLVNMQKQLTDDFVLVLASEEDLSRIGSFVDHYKFDLNFVRLESGLESIGVTLLPTTFIVAKDGRLIDTVVGSRKWDSDEQISELKNLVK